MVLIGELGAQNWCLLGDWREGVSGAGWEGFCLGQGDPVGCTAQGCWSPLARAKRNESLCPGAPSPCLPPALAPCGGQWGSPRWQQGREDRRWAGGCSLLLPTLVMLLPAREGTLCRARGGCTRQPNSPNSPSGCRTQPVQLPCMYRYLHMYRCSGLGAALPSGHTRDGDKGPSSCASHSPTPAHGTRHTHPPQPFPCITRSGLGLGGTVEVQGWATGVPPSQTGWGRANRAPHPGSGPALSCSPPAPAPSCEAGWGPGCARHRCHPASVAREGGEGLSLQPQHALPRAATATPLWPLLWLIHGWRILSGGREQGARAGGLEEFNCCPPRPSACPT